MSSKSPARSLCLVGFLPRSGVPVLLKRRSQAVMAAGGNRIGGVQDSGTVRCGDRGCDQQKAFGAGDLPTCQAPSDVKALLAFCRSPGIRI